MRNLNLILDTDVGLDCDDIVAIAYLIYAKKNFGLNIKAITHSNGGSEGGISAIASVFKFYNETVPLLGEEKGLLHENPQSYADAVAEKFGYYNDFLPAVKVLRKTLAENDDITICAIGPFTNIANLLTSQPDEYSDLNGVDLVKAKCNRIVVMAGQFDQNKPEWNVKVDILASKKMVELCPVPLIFLPFELGYNMISGGRLMKSQGENNPVSLSFIAINYGDIIENGGRHSWDPATTIYAVEGEKDFFTLSNAGTVTVDDMGATIFEEKANGKHYIIGLKHKDGLTEQDLKNAVAEYIDDCIDKI